MFIYQYIVLEEFESLILVCMCEYGPSLVTYFISFIVRQLN